MNWNSDETHKQTEIKDPHSMRLFFLSLSVFVCINPQKWGHSKPYANNKNSVASLCWNFGCCGDAHIHFEPKKTLFSFSSWGSYFFAIKIRIRIQFIIVEFDVFKHLKFTEKKLSNFRIIEKKVHFECIAFNFGGRLICELSIK